MTRLRAHLGPLWPYLVLIAIPTAAFVLPDLIGGRLLITGDNLQQNFPLHVLVGSMLRHGQLPFWNQYIFSGTPLMADFNAGAFYPLTGLFVALPDRAAWLATEVILFSAIAVGMYVFLRALKLSTMACLLAAATYAFAGPVLNQVNHVDMTGGFVAIPWMLLAVLHIVRDGRWRWTILLGIAYATVILAGAPEAMLDEALLVVAFAVLSAGLNRERWWRVLTRCGAGAALALSLAAIQWLPGLDAIRNSQRGSGFIAGAGSYPTPFTILSLVPYLNGGYGHLGEAQFFSQYNLPEVGIYLGILPIIALVTLLHPRWPSRIPPRDRLTWYGVGLVGLLLALGSNTPLEHLFNSLPLYGHQRLQSRNMITVATAVCVLFAGWIDRTEAPEVRTSMTRYDRVMALVPFGVVAALAIWALAAPGSLVHVFAGVPVRPRIVDTVREATAIALAFCAGGAVLVWIRPRLPAVPWSALAAVFVAFDIGLMGFTSQLVQTPTNDLLAGNTPIEKLMAAKLPPGGRMVNYDPQTYSSYPGSPQGIPDLNIIPGLPSVSGYASIVNSNYEATTHTHEQDDLDIGQLSSGTLGRLDLREVVTVPEYFLVPLQSAPRSFDDFTQVPEGFGADPVLPRGYGANFNETAYPFYPGPRPALAARRGTASWFFGETLEPDTVSLVLEHPASSGLLVRFGALSRRRDHAMGCAGVRPRGCERRDRSASGRSRRRSLSPGPRGLAAGPAGGDHSGRTVVRAGGFVVIGARAGSVADRRLLAGLRGVHLAQAPPAHRRLDRQRPAPARAGHLEHDEVRADPVPGFRACNGDPFGGMGFRLERHRLGQRRRGPHHPAERFRPGPTGPRAGRARRGDVPLPAATSHAREPSQPGRDRLAPGAVRCVARAPASPGDSRARRLSAPRGGSGGRAGASGLNRRRSISRTGGRGSAGIPRLRPPTSPRRRSRPPRARPPPVRA